MTKHPHIGSSLDELLKEEGIYEEAEGDAIKEVNAWQSEHVAKIISEPVRAS